MARSGLGDGTAGKSTTPVMISDPMAIKSPAAQAAQKVTSNMQQQAQGSSSAKTMRTAKGGGGSVDEAKSAMLPRQEKDDMAGTVNGVSANIDGYRRINKRRYMARGARPSLLTGR